MSHVPFEVEAQVEGGKVERGTVMAEPTASREYLLKRFIARHVADPGRRDFWYYQNARRGTVRQMPDLDKELPDPRQRKGRVNPPGDYQDWPAMAK